MADWPDWTGRDVAIVASGPSTKKAGVEHLKGRMITFAIKINIELCPWAEAVYGCDWPWWRHVGGLKDYKGHRLSYASRACDEFGCTRVQIPKPTGDALLFDKIGVVGAGGNSGFQAVNLAVQFGAKRLLLIGFDMTDRSGAHWYGRNSWHGGSNPGEHNFRRWLAAFNKAAPVLEKRGVEVINASLNSAMTCFRKETLAEALVEWGVLERA